MDIMNQLPIETVHIWYIHQQSFDNYIIEEFMDILSTIEKQKAIGFRFQEDRRIYVAGRGCLRMLIGRYLAKHPSYIQFNYSHYGKPCLKRVQNKADLSFSVSHSGDFIVYSFVCGYQIGIDIEVVKPIMWFESVVENVLTKKEHENFRKIAPDQQVRKFYEIWTVKEAYAKAIGLGLALPFKNIEVLTGINQPYQISLSQNKKNNTWVIKPLSIDPNHVANVVINGDHLKMATSPIDIHRL